MEVRHYQQLEVLVCLNQRVNNSHCVGWVNVVIQLTVETVKTFAEQAISKGSEIRTDGLPVYSKLANEGYTLVRKEFDPKKQPEHLHGTHIIVSNAKAFIDGTFHGLDSKHLQRYLDEFCYHLNRRWLLTSFFPNLLCVCIKFGRISNYEVSRKSY